MRSAPTWIVCAALGAACVSREDSPLPIDGSGIRAVVLAKVEDGRVQQAAAFAAEDATVALSATTGAFVALAYARTLEELDLVAGPLEPAPSGSLSRTLPTADATFRADANPDGVLEWKSIQQNPEELGGFWVSSAPAPFEPCPELEVIELCTKNRAWFTVGEALGDGRVFVANEDAEFYIATTSTISKIAAMPRTSSIAYNAGFTLADGRIALSCAIGDRLTIVDPSDGFSVDSGGPCVSKHVDDSASLVRLDGEDEPLFGASRGGVLVEIKENSPRALDPAPRRLLFDFLTYVGNSEAVITLSEPEIYWWKGSGLEATIPLWPNPDSPPAVFRATRHPRGFLLAALSERGGTNEFTVFDRSDASWHVIARSSMNAQIHDVQMFEDGFLYAGRNGQLGIYSPRTGFCPAPVTDPAAIIDRCDEPFPDESRGALGFYFLRPVGEDVFFAAGWNTGGLEQTNRVWFIRRSRQ